LLCGLHCGLSGVLEAKTAQDTSNTCVKCGTCRHATRLEVTDFFRRGLYLKKLVQTKKVWVATNLLYALKLIEAKSLEVLPREVVKTESHY
jgi:hypothetical protein